MSATSLLWQRGELTTPLVHSSFTVMYWMREKETSTIYWLSKSSQNHSYKKAFTEILLFKEHIADIFMRELAHRKWLYSTLFAVFKKLICLEQEDHVLPLQMQTYRGKRRVYRKTPKHQPGKDQRNWANLS